MFLLGTKMCYENASQCDAAAARRGSSPIHHHIPKLSRGGGDHTRQDQWLASHQLGDEAFDYCTSLTSVTIGTNVISIGGYAFSGCGSLTADAQEAPIEKAIQDG